MHDLEEVEEDKVFGLSFSRLLAATTIIMLTTLQDGVWLVPLVAHASSWYISIVHTITFIGAFAALSLSVGVLTVTVLTSSTAMEIDQKDSILSTAGASLCWFLAGFLYYKSWRKKRRKRQQEQLQQQENTEAANEGEQIRLITEKETDYESIQEGSTSPCVSGKTAPANSTGCLSLPSSDEQENSGADTLASSTQLQICLVVSLTILGSIDEVSYFPGLIVGKVFSVAELTLGTILASCIIVIIFCLCLTACRPVMGILDRVPLYAIVATFAVLLTADALWDFFTSSSS